MATTLGLVSFLRSVLLADQLLQILQFLFFKIIFWQAPSWGRTYWEAPGVRNCKQKGLERDWALARIQTSGVTCYCITSKEFNATLLIQCCCCRFLRRLPWHTSGLCPLLRETRGSIRGGLSRWKQGAWAATVLGADRSSAAAWLLSISFQYLISLDTYNMPLTGVLHLSW